MPSTFDDHHHKNVCHNDDDGGYVYYSNYVHSFVYYVYYLDNYERHTMRKTREEKCSLSHETVLAIRRYHIEDLRMRILELGDYTDITTRRPFIDLAGEWYFLEMECSFFNYSLSDMLAHLVKSGDVTTHEDVYLKINIDCKAYAARLIDSLYGKHVPEPVIPVLGG